MHICIFTGSSFGSLPGVSCWCQPCPTLRPATHGRCGRSSRVPHVCLGAGIRRSSSEGPTCLRLVVLVAYVIVVVVALVMVVVMVVVVQWW